MAHLLLPSFRQRPVHSISKASSRLAQRDRHMPLTTIRTFKALRQFNKFDDDFGVKTEDSNFPPYPYGPRKFFKQADKGLYGGAQLQYGNKISKGRNKGKTRRTWHPNVKLETVRSDALNQDLTIRITHSCMRTIKKCGGLDQYLLGDKPARIKELGLLGWRLRWKIMNSPSMKEKYKAERQNMGLPPRASVYETFQQAKQRPDFMEEIREEQAEVWEKLREKDAKYRSHVQKQWTRYDGKPWRIPQVIGPASLPSMLIGEPESMDAVRENDALREASSTEDIRLDPLGSPPEYGSALG